MTSATNRMSMTSVRLNPEKVSSNSCSADSMLLLFPIFGTEDNGRWITADGAIGAGARNCPAFEMIDERTVSLMTWALHLHHMVEHGAVALLAGAVQRDDAPQECRRLSAFLPAHQQFDALLPTLRRRLHVAPCDVQLSQKPEEVR